MKLIRYPEIEQFRNAIHKVTCAARHIGVDSAGDPIYDHTKVLPTLTYEGTVKLHGTNAAICWNVESSELWFQSRDTVLTMEKDNAGFVRHFLTGNKDLSFIKDFPLWNEIVIYGEWCGGSIQPTVALAQLSKRFVIFNIVVDGKWLPREFVSKVKDESINVYNIYDYQTETIEIDFNRPELSQNRLSELTIKVEESCPVAKAMGVDGIGEGIVWKCITPGWEDPQFYFKVKGELHAKSKVITLKPVDLEKLDKATTLSVKVTPEWRLAQMLDKSCDLMNGGKIDRSKLGNFIKLVTDDVIKEEADTIKDAGFDTKDINGHIAKIVRNYFFEREKIQ